MMPSIQIYLCEGTITVTSQLVVNATTKISCCNDCAVGLESTCVLEAGFTGDSMISGDIADSEIGFELDGTIMNGTSLVNARVCAATGVASDVFPILLPR